jgi:hypothetical protein
LINSKRADSHIGFTIRKEARAAVLKLITPFLVSQPYLIDKKGEAVNVSIKNRSAFSYIRRCLLRSGCVF